MFCILYQRKKSLTEAVYNVKLYLNEFSNTSLTSPSFSLLQISRRCCEKFIVEYSTRGRLLVWKCGFFFKSIIKIKGDKDFYGKIKNFVSKRKNLRICI